jgi:hypothetical protein
MDQGFGNLGVGGGSSSGGSNSNPAKAVASSSFLQLPLSTAGPAYYGAPLALLHQAAAGPSSSSQPPYGKQHAAEISPAEADAIKAKIVAHPQYSALLAAYLDCQKVGRLLACTHHGTASRRMLPVKIAAFPRCAKQDLLNLMPCSVLTCAACVSLTCMPMK